MRFTKRSDWGRLRWRSSVYFSVFVVPHTSSWRSTAVQWVYAWRMVSSAMRSMSSRSPSWRHMCSCWSFPVSSSCLLPRLPIGSLRGASSRQVGRDVGRGTSGIWRSSLDVLSVSWETPSLLPVTPADTATSDVTVGIYKYRLVITESAIRGSLRNTIIRCSLLKEIVTVINYPLYHYT